MLVIRKSRLNTLCTLSDQHDQYVNNVKRKIKNSMLRIEIKIVSNDNKICAYVRNKIEWCVYVFV